MSSARSAQWVAIGILLSRISGLVRTTIFARYFGATLYADAFNAALRMPNVLQNLLGEGTMSASFIPVYAALIEKGKEEEAGRVAGAIFALLVAVAAALSLIGIALAPVLVTLSFPGFEGLRRDLTITCTRIIFPMAGVLVLHAWSLGILNSHRRFFIPYVAPVLWNAAIIATMVWFGRRQSLDELVVTLAWSALVGGVLQFAVQLPWLLRLERNLKISLNLRLQGVRAALRTSGHAISGRGVVQLSGWADMFFGSLMYEGAIAMLGYAQILYMLPISLFGISVAAAELPELSRNRDATAHELARRLNSGLRRIAILVVPTVVGYLLLGDIVVATLFQHGRFTAQDTFLVSLILMAYTTGLLASTATRLFSSAFFALQDTRTPARIAWVRVAVAAAVAGLVTLWVRFIDQTHLQYGPVGIALASGLGAWVEWGLLRNRLHTRIPGVGLGRSLLFKLIAVALVAAAVGRIIASLLPPISPWLAGLLVLSPYAALYLGMVHALGVEIQIPLISRFLPKHRDPGDE